MQQHRSALRARRPGFVLLALAVAAMGCDDDRNDVTDAEALATLAPFALTDEALPPSPTNAYADDPAAASLGRTLFFERGLSSDGTVACADCHDPAGGFSDTRRFSLGVRDQAGARHSMPITSAALQPYLLWDGRADTVWRQPLYALENPREMDFSRADVALFVASTYASAYEAAFGPLPDLAGTPAGARPGDAAWEALSPALQDGVQRVFVNVGKALEAYERQLACRNTRFDRWLAGSETLTDRELEGVTLFVDRGCINCHRGPALSDGAFHNLGIVREGDTPIDTGRQEGLAILLADELNGASVYSDDPVAGRAKLAVAARETGTRAAFRTASLRGASQRARFGHRGLHTDLAAFIEDTYRRGRGGRGGRGDGDGDGDGNGNIVGALDPLLDDVNAGGDDADAIATFLGATACAAPSPELLSP